MGIGNRLVAVRVIIKGATDRIKLCALAYWLLMLDEHGFDQEAEASLRAMKPLLKAWAKEYEQAKPWESSE